MKSENSFGGFYKDMKKSLIGILLAATMLSMAACSIFLEDSSSASQSEEVFSSEKTTGSEESLLQSEEYSEGKESCLHSEEYSESSVEESFEEEISSGRESASDKESASSPEKEVYYTVVFDTDGGSEIASVSVLAGGKITKPQNPNKSTKNCDYIFLGWFYNGKEWNFEKDVVTKGMTLVAHWKEGERYTDTFLPQD